MTTHRGQGNLYNDRWLTSENILFFSCVHHYAYLSVVVFFVGKEDSIQYDMILMPPKQKQQMVS